MQAENDFKPDRPNDREILDPNETSNVPPNAVPDRIDAQLFMAAVFLSKTLSAQPETWIGMCHLRTAAFAASGLKD
jgi:hypothetical protein